MEKHVRSLAKTVFWRIAATSTTVPLVFLFTGDSVTNAGVGFLELLSKDCYLLHM